MRNPSPPKIDDTPIPEDLKDGPACRNYDPDWWFPEQKGNQNAVMAITICYEECAVFAACQKFARDSRQEFGIWAGEYTW